MIEKYFIIILMEGHRTIVLMGKSIYQKVYHSMIKPLHILIREIVKIVVTTQWESVMDRKVFDF